MEDKVIVNLKYKYENENYSSICNTPSYTFSLTSTDNELNEEDMCDLFTKFMHSMGYNTKKRIYYEEENC